MEFYGNKYLVVGQYHQGDTLYLHCVEELGGKISTFPASITDFFTEINPKPSYMDIKTHFTITGLKSVASILDNAAKMSTE